MGTGDQNLVYWPPVILGQPWYSEFSGSNGSLPLCRYCGKWHTGNGMCPQVKEIEYHPNGTVKRVVLR